MSLCAEAEVEREIIQIYSFAKTFKWSETNSLFVSEEKLFFLLEAKVPLQT